MVGTRRFMFHVSGLLTLSAVFGCHPDESGPTPVADRVVNEFDSSSAGTIQGRVTWEGALPVVSPLAVKPNPLGVEILQRRQLWPNPNAPQIDALSRAVRGAVVFLRGVDPRRAHPWTHPPVVVEQRDYRFVVRQGDAEVSTGFVRRGDAVTLVSGEDVFHSLHADGSAFFTLTFPDPHRPRQRKLERTGVVELTSAAGYFWMRTYLLVDEHPYYTRTDADGRFTLPEVPPGHYEVVCWLPNWNPRRRERDPESGHVTRLYFQPPIECARSLTLAPKETGEVRLSFGP